MLEFLACRGFGYDSSSDDYKVIVVYTFRYISEETVVDVFSLKSNKWKSIEETHHTTVVTRDATVLRGALHWLNCSTSYDGIRKLKLYKIIAFDFEKEEFQEMSIPNNDRRFKLMVVGGCLCLYKEYVPNEMWVMKEYERSLPHFTAFLEVVSTSWIVSLCCVITKKIHIRTLCVMMETGSGIMPTYIRRLLFHLIHLPHK